MNSDNLLGQFLRARREQVTVAGLRAAAGADQDDPISTPLGTKQAATRR